MNKEILLTFDLEQVCNDLLAKCYLVSQSIRDKALEDIKASISTPDSQETRSIICRAITEAFGKTKVACQRYLTVGRTADSNILERLVKGVTYTKDQAGNDTDEVDQIIYEKVMLKLSIPNFNIAVTDHLKSSIHKYVVDYVTWRFLQDQHSDKAAEYKALADGDDYSDIVSDLNARESYSFRRASWI